MIEFILNLTAIAFAAVGFVCIAFGVPIIAVNTIRMSRRKKAGDLSWHDLWGLNRNNLLFFPSLLDAEGQRFRRLALRGGKVILIGIIATLSAYYLGAFSA